MVTKTIDNSNSPTTMRLRLTYTSGSGNITISKIESCRTDGYGTTDRASCTVTLKVGSSTKTFTASGLYFNANSSYTTITDTAYSFNVTGSQTVTITFSSANSNISGAKFTTTINAGVKVPSFELASGYDADHKITLTSSATAGQIAFTLSNTNGQNTSFQYYVGSWKTFTTKNADGNYQINISNSQATEIMSYLKNTTTPQISTRVTNSNGTSATKTAYFYVDISIIPTLGSISVSATNSYSAFSGLFVKGLSKPSITFNNAQGIQGSTISSYYLQSLTGDSRTHALLTMSGSTATTSNFNNVSVVGTNTAICYVKDSRGRNSASKNATFNVIDYANPNISSLKVERCNQDGTLNSDGTYAKLTIGYKIYPVNNGSTDKNTRYLGYSLNGTSYTQITLSSWEGTITQVVGGSFDTNQTYPIYVKVQDVVTSTIKSSSVSPSARLVSKIHTNSGEGITFGQIATQTGLHDYLGAIFHNGLSIEKKGTTTPVIAANYSYSTNGYIKFENGLMFQWLVHNATITMAGTGNVAYGDIAMPNWTEPFTTLFFVLPMCTNKNAWASIGEYTNTSAGTIRVYRPTIQDGTYYVRAFAIGRWKEPS